MSKFSENPDNAKFISTAKFLFGGWIRSGVWLLVVTVLVGHVVEVPDHYYWVFFVVSAFWVTGGVVRFLFIWVPRLRRKAIRPPETQKADIQVKGIATREQYDTMREFCERLATIFEKTGLRVEAEDETKNWDYPQIYSLTCAEPKYTISLELLLGLTREDYEKRVQVIEYGLGVTRCQVKQNESEKRDGRLRIILVETDPLDESFPLPDEDEG